MKSVCGDMGEVFTANFEEHYTTYTTWSTGRVTDVGKGRLSLWPSIDDDEPVEYEGIESEEEAEEEDYQRFLDF